MKYEDMNMVLVQYFPNLKSLYDWEADKNDWYHLDPYTLFPYLLNPYVKELLSDGKDIDMIKRVFDFYEEMAQSKDEEVRNLLQVAVLEDLWEKKATFNQALMYMLPHTLAKFKEIGKYLRKPTDRTDRDARDTGTVNVYPLQE